jgi:methylmalonyl-CoA mutase N-terminal domain/subunit
MHDLEDYGGMVKAIEEGFVQRMIADEAHRFQQELDSGRRKVVGVNMLKTDEGPPDITTFEMDEESRRFQLKRLASVKQSRDGDQVAATLGALRTGAGRDDVNLMPLLIDCANAYCTVGEMVKTLKDVWGEFKQPVVF